MLVSAFAFGGTPQKAVFKVFSESEIVVSPQLLKEYRDIPFRLEAEGKINLAQLKVLLSGIASFVVKAKVVIPKKKLHLCRDEKDNMILECCLAANADLLITGDKDLLHIQKSELDLEFSHFKIVSPAIYVTA